MGDRVAVMSMGVLQQVDTPQQLYDAPRNVFVASFIGTPPMNLFDADDPGWTTAVAVMLGSTRIAVGQACVARYRGIRELNGRKAVIGDSRRRPVSGRRPVRITHDRCARRTRRGARLRRHGALPHRRRSGARRRRTSTGGGGGRRTATSTGVVAAARPNLSRTSRLASSCGSADTVPVAIDPGALHFFDEETGARAQLGRVSSRSSSDRGSRLRRASRLRRGAGARDAAPPTGAALDALSKPPTYSRFASQRIYFVMPDRYANGDPSNDRGGMTGSRSVTGFDPSDPGWYHGGDLKGLTGGCTDPGTVSADQGPRLHRDLGDAGRRPAGRAGRSAAYHGYWGVDFTDVDRHLGSAEDFKAFTDCAHRLG